MRRSLVTATALAAALLFPACSSDHDTADGSMPMHDGSMPTGGGMHDMPGGMDHSRGGPIEDSPVPADAGEITVKAASLAFTPNELTVAVGEPMAIRLESDDLEHDLIVDEVGLHVHAEAGQSATGGFTATEPGTYTIYCSVPGHRETGMVGTLTVTPT